MTPQEFFDKENGTTFALDGPSMSDTDRNIMRSLQHEGCEAHCDGCGACITEPVSGYSIGNDEPMCKNCQDNVDADAHAEAVREARDASMEAAFNARWPR